MRAEPRSLTFSERIYNLLLYAYPAPFRQEYGRHMVQVFCDEARDTLQHNGPIALTSLWVLTLIDLIKTALAEHIWEVFHMPLEKLERWSGPAAAIGAPLFIATFLSYSFWKAIDTIGIADNPFIHPILAGVGLLLMAIGLFGLYRRLPAGTRLANGLAFGLSLLGILVTMVGVLGLIVPLPESIDSLTFLAFLVVFVGVAGMGVIALSKKALGVWSFVPLALFISIVGFGLTFEAMERLGQIFIVIHVACWVLLGFALWTTPNETPDMALPA